MSRRLLLVLLALTPLLKVAGCPCSSSPLVYLAESFESCRDAGCGWTIDGKSAAPVTTFHRAEHAMALDDASMSRSLDIEPRDDRDLTLELSLVTDCREGLSVVLDWNDGSRQTLLLAARCPYLSQQDDGEQDFATRCADIASTKPPNAKTIERIVITASKRCLVDRLLIYARDLNTCG
jgi:hypothetical protein